MINGAHKVDFLSGRKSCYAILSFASLYGLTIQIVDEQIQVLRIASIEMPQDKVAALVLVTRHRLHFHQVSDNG